MPTRLRSLCTAVLAATSLAVGALATGPGAVAAPSGAGSPGSPGVGDRIFPLLGNGGYDVGHYTLDFAFDSSLRTVDAVVRIEATATQNLSRFDLDYDAGPIRSVSVNGRQASTSRHGAELVVTPAQVLGKGSRFTVRVAYRTGPRPYRVKGFLPTWPWLLTKSGGSVVAAQPDAAHDIFPSNDHPSDKATFTFHVTAPKGVLVVANGARTAKLTTGRRTAWTYQMREPMATELMQLAVGREFVEERSSGPGGVVIRHVVPAEDRQRLQRLLRPTAGEVGWMQRRVGPYPFAEYGILEADQDLYFALETQSLSLFSTNFVAPSRYFDPIAVHELAHQWFGDAVAPLTWSDVWLNEGHATWYQYAYMLRADPSRLDTLYRSVYLHEGQHLRDRWGPVARPRAHNSNDLFNNNVYDGGALALYALRQKVGAATFEAIERAWYLQYRGHSAGTAQFIALASRVAGRDLGGFLHDWLLSTTLPPMPGHPGWHPVTGQVAGPVTGQVTGQATASMLPPPVLGLTRR